MNPPKQMSPALKNHKHIIIRLSAKKAYPPFIMGTLNDYTHKIMCCNTKAIILYNRVNNSELQGLFC